MPIMTDAQRVTVSTWRTGLVALNVKATMAADLLNGLTALNGETLLNGKVNTEDLWPDAGDKWNDRRQELIDAAEALPVYETG